MNKYIENINQRNPQYLQKYNTPGVTYNKKVNNPIIPNMYNIEDNVVNLQITNYKTKDLKQLLNTHELYTVGSKLMLWNRLIGYLKISSMVIKIQTLYRKWILTRIFKLFNKYEISKKKCVNDNDFYNLDDLIEIPKYQFISFEDIDHKYYGFNISSLYELLNTNSLNPYNRNIIPVYIIDEINSIVKYKDILHLPTIFKINMECDTLNITQLVELRAVRLFQYINELGNYSDSIWYMSLTQNTTIRLVRYLKDIWCYRAELTNLQKNNICPMGDPFNNFSIIYTTSIIDFKNNVLDLLEKFVYYGINVESKILGAYYVLGALTLVNLDAAESIPWLYDSFRD